MTLTAKDLAIDNTSYDIDMATGKSVASVRRAFSFRSGETVSFTVQLPSRTDMTLVDLHRDSLQRAIDILQAMLNPEPVPMPGKSSLTNRLA